MSLANGIDIVEVVDALTAFALIARNSLPRCAEFVRMLIQTVAASLYSGRGSLSSEAFDSDLLRRLAVLKAFAEQIVFFSSPTRPANNVLAGCQDRTGRDGAT